MRVYRDCYDMANEQIRDLLQAGITVEVNHYQNKKLYGDERFTKELVGVSFTISKPMKKRKEMLDFLFREESDTIEKYCQQEFEDRVCGKSLNPGNSYKIRKDMWQKFLEGEEETEFSYTYSERFNKHNQLNNLIDCLKEDKHTRQAILQVYQASEDSDKFGGNTRIPCSVDFQVMIRNNRVNLVYHMRSNDALGHFGVDIWLAAELMEHVCSELQNTYQGLKTGSLTYFAGSFHAYQWDLKQRVIF